jgi:hypothetical protein
MLEILINLTCLSIAIALLASSVVWMRAERF